VTVAWATAANAEVAATVTAAVVPNKRGCLSSVVAAISAWGTKKSLSYSYHIDHIDVGMAQVHCKANMGGATQALGVTPL